MYVIRDFSSGSGVWTSVIAHQHHHQVSWSVTKQLPSGSRRRVTPYSRSTMWNAESRRSQIPRFFNERQSTKSGLCCLKKRKMLIIPISNFCLNCMKGRINDHLLRWMMALKASPSFQELVKSVTRTPGYFAVDLWTQRSRAFRAVILSSWPTIMSDICIRQLKEYQCLTTGSTVLQWKMLQVR